MTGGTFYSEVIVRDPRFNSPLCIRDLALLEPVTRAAVQAIIADAAAMGIDLRVSETFRSQARQEQLYAKGLTQLKKVGVHHFGVGVDFMKMTADGKPSWSGDWTFLGKLAKRHGLLWGGTWAKFPDRDHVQRCAVADQERLFSGDWYPEPEYQATQASDVGTST